MAQMSKKQWLLTGVLTPIVVALVPCTLAWAESRAAVSKADEKVTREQLDTTIKNITEKFDRSEREHTKLRDEYRVEQRAMRKDFQFEQRELRRDFQAAQTQNLELIRALLVNIQKNQTNKLVPVKPVVPVD